MYGRSELRREIEHLIEASDSRMSSSWLATAISGSHPMPASWTGDDREFWTLNGLTGLQDEIRAFLRSLKSRQDESAIQMDLPGIVMSGFRYLQKKYLVPDPEDPSAPPVIVPLDEMSDEQIEQKITEQERMAHGCLEHAKELRRYLKDRTKAA